MPTTGYVSITVSEQVHRELKDFAEATHRSIPKLIEYLMEQAKNEKKKEA